MKRRAFLSNGVRAGHTTLKASLNRFNIVFTAECKCGDCLQTEEGTFRDSKRYEDQQATMMDILSENSKKEYLKPVTELLKLEENDLCKACYFINNIPLFV
jgi:Fe-S-cluster containining protein